MSCEKCGASASGCDCCSSGAAEVNFEKRGDACIALLGQPNSGKSTLFNGLTGSRQHVGNWPGKTVERKVGEFSRGEKNYQVVDLPGAYGLSANSPEEQVTVDFVASGTADVTLVMADASQLERSLYMLADFACTSPGAPCVLVLNLMDVAEQQGRRIDAKKIEERLGVPVVPFVAADVSNYDVLLAAIDRAIAEKRVLDTTVLKSELSARANTIQGRGAAKFAWIEKVVDGAEVVPSSDHKLSRFDRLATASRASKPLAIGMILLGFVAAFIPATPIMLLGGCISSLGQMAASALIAAGLPAILANLLWGVVANSLCFAVMMIGYVFGINLVFLAYEEWGYMARISYVFDETLSRFGLQGKSLMPFLMCFGCTMGGVSGARVIDSWGQRMLTMMMSWAIPCATTWGIVPILAVTFFGVGAPLVIVGIFAVCLLVMWLIGMIFGPKLVPAGERAGLVMELPPYHKPRVKNVLRGACLKCWSMFRRSLKVVSLFTLIIWLLTYTASGNMEDSVLYAIGVAIEPVTRIFGMGWQTFTAWFCALAIKESAVGVFSALFAGGSTPNAAIVGAVTGSAFVAPNIGEIIAAHISAPEALAFIFAFTFNMPCAASCSMTVAEAHSPKWVAITAAFYICASLLLGCAAYHVGLLLF